MSEETTPRWIIVYRIILDGKKVDETTNEGRLPYLLEKWPGATIKKDRVKVA